MFFQNRAFCNLIHYLLIFLKQIPQGGPTSSKPVSVDPRQELMDKIKGGNFNLKPPKACPTNQAGDLAEQLKKYLKSVEAKIRGSDSEEEDPESYSDGWDA